MKKETGIILLGLGAATAAAVLVSQRMTKALVDEALNRDEPKIVKSVSEKLIGSYAEKEPYKSAIPAVRELETAPTKQVEITSDDGLRLVGHWYPAEKPERIILAMHGWRSNWASDFGPCAPFWHSEGCSVLFAEQRGQGMSEGEYMGFGVSERYDVLSWVKWICENTEDKLPIYLAGVSMGASTVLMASGLELPERVCGVMADCGFTSAEAIFRHVTKSSLHLSYNLMNKYVETIFRKKISAGTEDCSTIDAMKVNTRPVLFIHGTDDGFVPVTMTYENYKACQAPKALFVVPGADHGASYLIDKEGYEKAVRKFFAKYDNYEKGE